MQVQHYIFGISAILIVIALVLFKFFPKLRGNSFQLQGSESLKKEWLETLKPLDEKYATEISEGEAVFIKGKASIEPKFMVKEILSRFLAFILIILIISITFSLIDNPFDGNCYFNENLSVELILMVFLYVYTPISLFLPKFFEIFTSLKRGRQTGWDGDIHHNFKRDTVIFKYSKVVERNYLLRLFVLFIITLPLIFAGFYVIKIQYFSETSNFFEANKISYQKCIAKQNGLNNQDKSK